VQSDETDDQTVMLNDLLDGQFDQATDPSVVESTLGPLSGHDAPGHNVNLTSIKTNVLERQVDVPAVLPQEPATPPGCGGTLCSFR
jgi:hypothetical protein